MPTIRPKADVPAKPRRKAKAAPPRPEPPQPAPPQSEPGAPGEPTSLSPDAIASRAYEIFVQRGGEHGRDLDDWVAAERELAGGA